MMWSIATWSQTSDENYIMSMTAREPISGSLETQKDDETKVSTEISYFDGLGRPIQIIKKEASTNSLDLVTPISYDQYGRQVRNYLEYESDQKTGNIIVPGTALKDQATFYKAKFGDDDGKYAFSEVLLESSGLGRVLKQAAPGEIWKIDGSHTVEMKYRSNTSDDAIKPLRVTIGNTIDFEANNFSAGQLWVNVTEDENEGSSEGVTMEFLDKQGKVVAKKVQATSTTYYTTYYIYDHQENLRYVIQPAGVAEIISQNDWSLVNNEAFQKKWMFCYQYDNRNRLIAKRIPGADWVYMIYDQRNRLVLTQSGNDRPLDVNGNITIDGYKNTSYNIINGSVTLKPGFVFQASTGKEFLVSTLGTVNEKWIFTKYDALNRPVMTGQYRTNKSRQELVADVDGLTDFSTEYTGSGPLFGYDNSGFPTQVSISDLLTVTYYDNYDFKSDQGWSADFNYTHIDLETSLKGQTTGAMARILASDQWLKSISYYDSRYRVIAAITENHKGGVDKVETTYRNKVHARVEQTVTTHNVSGGSDLVVTETFDYDHMDRLKEATHQIGNGTTVRLSASEYNELGEAIQKKVGSHNGGSTFAQTIDYAYNIRGWLTTINGGTSLSGNDKFGMALKYDDASSGFEQYNGNIGEIQWKTLGGGSLNQGVQTYTYSYDRLNRLKKANYNSTGAVNHFTVGGDDNGQIRYDHNGNILNLNRNFNGSMVDNLSYTYINGNQLAEVSDLGTTALFEDKNPANGAADYSYDANGNMISDYNKDITQIHYNHLNLPEMVVMDDGDYVKYTYDAAGIKLQKEARQGANVTVTDYISGKHYVNGTLSFLQHAEGRARYDASSFHYEYNLTDHLGNVRVSVDESGNVVQRDDYYPFGLSFNSYASGTKNNYLYNGKEEQEEWGVIDYGARMYQPDLGRWFNIDPMSEKFASWSVYHYGYNRPISVIDPNGMENIAVVGAQNDEREGNKLMFVNQALRSMRRWSKNESEESRTMVVFKGDYTEKQMSKIGASVEKFGGKLVVVNSAEELINYTNSGDVGNSEVSEARLGDQVTDMDIYSHGVTGSIEFGYGTENAGSYRLDESNVGGFKSGAFGSDAVVTSYACRTGLGNTNINFFMAPFESMNVEGSLAQQMANSTGATVRAYAQRTSYAGTLGNAADRRIPTLYPVPQTTIVDGAAFTPNGANRPVGPGGSPLGVDPRLLIFRPRK